MLEINRINSVEQNGSFELRVSEQLFEVCRIMCQEKAVYAENNTTGLWSE